MPAWEGAALVANIGFHRGLQLALQVLVAFVFRLSPLFRHAGVVPAVGHNKERRLQETCQDGEDQRAADDDDGQRLLGLRDPMPCESAAGQQPQGGHERRHKHRTEALLRGLRAACSMGVPRWRAAGSSVTIRSAS